MLPVIVKPIYRRVIICVLSLVPFLWLVYRIITQQLGPDPAKAVAVFTGEWTLYFLFFTLAVTPLRKLFKWNWLATHRRMLGLFSLFYALLHVSAFALFILGLDISRFAKELIERPYITVGMPAVVILIALGITSTKGMIKRLGKNWARLHKLVYLAVILAWVHVLWQVRASYFEAFVYGVITAVLLLIRLYWYFRKRLAQKNVITEGT